MLTMLTAKSIRIQCVDFLLTIRIYVDPHEFGCHGDEWALPRLRCSTIWQIRFALINVCDNRLSMAHSSLTSTGYLSLERFFGVLPMAPLQQLPRGFRRSLQQICRCGIQKTKVPPSIFRGWYSSNEVTAKKAK